MSAATFAILLAMLQATPGTPPADPPPPLPVAGTNAMGGRVFRIPGGLVFDSIAASLRPGDEVVLERGVHLPFSLADLRGEPGRPIVIRGEIGEGPVRMPYVKATAYGIRLVRPRHVVLRDLMVGNGSGPLVLLEGERGPDGSPVESNSQVAALRLVQENPAPSQDGVVLRDIDRVDVREVAIRGWNRAAVRVERSSRCSVNFCMLDPVRTLPQETGLDVSRGCRQVAAAMLTMGPRVRTGFRLGSCEGIPADTPPAEAVLVMRCSVPEPDRFAWIGGVRGLVLRWNTVADPRVCVWQAVDACGLPSEVTLLGNLFSWRPGMIERICDVPASLPADSVRLGENLWWSEEIPAAFEAIGRPFGVEAEPQRLDVDPRLEPRFASPLEEKARNFGWQAPDPDMPPPAKAPPASPPEGTPPG